MIQTLENQKACLINPLDLKHLKIQAINSEFTVTLTDASGNGILKGYGSAIEEAINDLHHSLI